MQANVLVASCLALLLAAPAGVAGQESLSAARELYAAAEYQNALDMLDTLLAGSPQAQERQSIELYRVFCLFAVDRVDEATGALEAMIQRDPLSRLSVDIVPRRLRPAFSDARKRLLPTIVQDKYRVAKAAFDQGDYKAAAVGFTQTLVVLSDPEIAAEAEQGPLADLSVLATGFHELSVRAMAPPPPVPAAAAPPPAAAKPSAPAIYQAGDAGVTLPIAVRQDMPTFPSRVLSQRSGILEVVIDESGAVESANIVTSLEPRYNTLVLAAAKFWRYRPATVSGVPVKFRKRIQMTISPE